MRITHDYSRFILEGTLASIAFSALACMSDRSTRKENLAYELRLEVYWCKQVHHVESKS